MSAEIKTKKQLFKKKRYRRYFRYFFTCIAILMFCLQLIFVNTSNIWDFDNILPLAINGIIIFYLLVISIRSKRYRARKRALKQKKEAAKLFKV